MVAKSLVTSDKFYSLSDKAKLLYYECCIRADDDGAVDNIKVLMKILKVTKNSLNLLIENGYIILFNSGVAFVRHWRVHNYIQKDRYRKTQHIVEYSLLSLDENGVYQLYKSDEVDENCIQNVHKMDTQVRGGKVRGGKVRGGKVRGGKVRSGESEVSTAEPPSPAYGEYKNVFLTEEEYDELKSAFPDTYESKINRLSGYMAQTGKVYQNHYATIKSWAKEDAEKDKQRNVQKETLPSSFETDDFFDAALMRCYGGDADVLKG